MGANPDEEVTVGEETEQDESSAGSSDPSVAFQDKPPADEVEEIEAERKRRLAAENRPDNAEVDNTGDNMPDIAREDHSGEGAEGTADPSRTFRENPPSEDEVEEIEAERKRRLAPENRPDNAEVDNTGDNMPDIAKG